MVHHNIPCFKRQSVHQTVSAFGFIFISYLLCKKDQNQSVCTSKIHRIERLRKHQKIYFHKNQPKSPLNSNEA